MKKFMNNILNIFLICIKQKIKIKTYINQKIILNKYHKK